MVLNGLKIYQALIKNLKNLTLIKNYDEDSDKGRILDVGVEYPKNLHDLQSDLPFLPERMKIYKCNKLVWNLYDKKTSLFT